MAAEAQAACTWQRTALPTPAGHTKPLPAGIGGEYLVASTTTSSKPGIVRWHNGTPTIIGVPTADPAYYGRPTDVSANGTVVATLVPLGGPPVGDPYVTLPDGNHKFLPKPAGWRQVDPVAINGSGDVVGHVFSDGVVKLVRWNAPDYSSAAVYDVMGGIGIDDSGFSVSRTGIKHKPGAIADPLVTPEGATSIYVAEYDNDVAVGSAQINGVEQAVAWNPDGSIRYLMSSGRGQSANKLGTVVGLKEFNETLLWRGGQPAALPKPPPSGSSIYVTERDTLIGLYRDNNTGPLLLGEWSCS